MSDRENGSKLISMSIGLPAFDDKTPVYANHIAVQFTGGEYTIAFYAAFPPVLLGTPEECRAKAREIREIPATCVAKIVVSKDKMPLMVKALAENVVRHQPETMEAPAEDEGNG